MKQLLVRAALVTALVAPQMAQASQIIDDSVFDSMAVSDGMLAVTRGGRSPFAQLTVGTAKRMTDDMARADLRQTGSVARIQMDVWWGSTGSELIAQNVRAAGAY